MYCLQSVAILHLASKETLQIKWSAIFSDLNSCAVAFFATVPEEKFKMRKIPFSPPDLSQAEIDEVIKVLKSGWITTGPEKKLFESRIAER